MEQADSTHASTGKPEKYCILHTGNDEGEKSLDIKSLTENQWETIKEVVTKRKSKKIFSESVYYNVIMCLPEDMEEEHGYHTQCYRKFTALPREVLALGPSMLSQQLRSSSATPTATSSGIFTQSCIFCNKKKV